MLPMTSVDVNDVHLTHPLASVVATELSGYIKLPLWRPRSQFDTLNRFGGKILRVLVAERFKIVFRNSFSILLQTV